jgi:hypothetical protein
MWWLFGIPGEAGDLLGGVGGQFARLQLALAHELSAHAVEQRKGLVRRNFWESLM